MDLYPTVDGEELARHDRVRGDLVVEGEPAPNGTFRPKRIHLLNFSEIGGDSADASSEEG